MKAKIESIVERVRYISPTATESSLVISYVTDKGFRSSIELPKKGFTEAKVFEAIKKDAEAINALIEKEKEL